MAPVAAAVVLSLAGCTTEEHGDAGGSSTGTKASTTAKSAKKDDKALALKAWKRFIKKRAAKDAQVLGLEVVKLDPDVGDPEDYGQGFKQAAGTAYAEVQLPDGTTSGTIYSAELNDSTGKWRVKPSSVEQQSPEDALG